jgi:transposase
VRKSKNYNKKVKDIMELSNKNVSSQELDHLGLIAATIDKLGIIKKIDELLPINGRGSKVSHGERVTAMIFNAFGFMDSRLYMFSQFLEKKPLKRLMREDINADDFNDDALGRCLDAIAEYGTTKLFGEIAFRIAKKMKFIGKSIHVDTTTLSVYGEYEEDPNSEETPKPKFGYPKNGRFDLKQMVLLLGSTGESGFPIWMESHSGNESDKVSLERASQRMHEFYEKLKEADPLLFVQDSAGYEACLKNDQSFLWLSRVPESHKLAKEKISQKDEEIAWTDYGNGYKGCAEKLIYKNVEQRWALIFSQKAYDREIKTLEKNIEKEREKLTKSFESLLKKKYGCPKDALKHLQSFKRTMKYHMIIDESTQDVLGYKEQGRPKKDQEKQVMHVLLKGKLIQNDQAIMRAKLNKGRFILATNQLDTQALKDEELLTQYKEQTKVEQGFRFIKDNAFEVSSIFLKKDSRINALMMVMTLCLMVYNVAQHDLRKALEKANETVPTQTKKTTQKPTMKWICQMFSGVSVVFIKTNQKVLEIITNLKEDPEKIVRLFGKKACLIYGVPWEE